MPRHEVPRPSAGWRTSTRVGLGLAVAASALATLALADGSGRFTTYAGTSGLAAALTVAVGISLGVAGLVTSLGPASQWLGDLTLLAALIWFAPVWVGWAHGPLLVRSIGMVAAGFMLPLITHVVLTFPGGRAPTRVARAMIATTYVETTLVAAGTALFRQPFLDPYCWANCTDNVFVVRAFPDATRAIVVSDQWFEVGVAACLAMLCVWRLGAASSPARRILLPVTVPAVLYATAVAVRALALVDLSIEDPAEQVFHDIFILECAALILIAAAVVWGSLRRRLRHRAVSRIASNLGDAPQPGSVEAALGRAVGDPGLRIAYWLPDSATYVESSSGQAAELATEPGRVITTLVRGDQRVAVVSHAPDVSDIESAMGSTLRLALDNERLQARGLAQLEELRASRARIVETGDRERQRLERDLHDGAQQRLLAASYEIRLARSSAESAGDVPTAALLADALRGAHAALDELRELAQGLYPAILEEAGLAAALATLSDTAPVVVTTRGVVEGRYPAAVEIAAYLTVVEAVEDAAARDATFLTVVITRHDGVLFVALDEDGAEPATALVHAADRVGALGGRLEVGPAAVRAEIPCA